MGTTRPGVHPGCPPWGRGVRRFRDLPGDPPRRIGLVRNRGVGDGHPGHPERGLRAKLGGGSHADPEHRRCLGGVLPLLPGRRDGDGGGREVQSTGFPLRRRGGDLGRGKVLDSGDPDRIGGSRQRGQLCPWSPHPHPGGRECLRRISLFPGQRRELDCVRHHILPGCGVRRTGCRWAVGRGRISRVR